MVFPPDYVEQMGEIAEGYRKAFARMAIFLAVLFVILCAVFYGVYRLIAALLPSIPQLPTAPRLGVMVAALVLATLLFALRVKWQHVYGVTELAFGGVSLWEASALFVDNASKAPLLIAAIYVVIRGLVNIKDGIARRIELANNPLKA